MRNDILFVSRWITFTIFIIEVLGSGRELENQKIFAPSAHPHKVESTQPLRYEINRWSQMEFLNCLPNHFNKRLELCYNMKHIH